MWMKMNQQQINEMLDERIRNYKKNQKIYFAGGSAVMLALSFCINYFLFPLGIPFLHSQYSTGDEVVIRIFIIFLVFELIIAVLMIFDNIKYFKMDIREKREYFFKGIKRNNSKICIKCGVFFINDEIRCDKCGEPLEMAYECIWIEDTV
jgi:hypothetical protein